MQITNDILKGMVRVINNRLKEDQIDLRYESGVHSIVKFDKGESVDAGRVIHSGTKSERYDFLKGMAEGVTLK